MIALIDREVDFYAAKSENVTPIQLNYNG